MMRVISVSIYIALLLTPSVSSALPALDVPLNLVFTPGTSEVSVDWSGTPGFDSQPYSLVEQLDNGRRKIIDPSGSLYENTLTDSGVYRYRLVQRGSLLAMPGFSVPTHVAASTSVSLTVHPESPQGVQITGNGEPGGLVVGWSPTADSNIDQYIVGIRLAADTVFTYHTMAVTPHSPQTSYVLADMPAGDYVVQVKARTEVDDVDLDSAYVSLNSSVPNAASLVAPNYSDDGTLNLSWEDDSQYTYFIEEQSGDGTWVSVTNVQAGSYELSGLVDGIYNYRVKTCTSENICSAWEEVAEEVVVNTPEPYFRPDSTVIPVGDSTAGTPYYGVTKGSFSVGRSGAANYELPLMIPPGINGMAPKLSLSYSSQRGNGVVGQSWAIGGLSKIHRCRATLARDGYYSGVNYGDNFKYCLDGQRLVQVAAGEWQWGECCTSGKSKKRRNRMASKEARGPEWQLHDLRLPAEFSLWCSQNHID